ncbi:hypothetical protein ACHAXA_002105 [Cyclostephanos tholiformis]|uniref:Meckelin n=1 Tax=Cyclostephanos tholiformis TaxID=382380 RepID=A0ABD3STQ7_9STRA
MAVSRDQRVCIPCSNTDQNLTYESSEYDVNSSDCTCKNPMKGLPTRKRVVAKKLVEIYDSSGSPIRKDCLRCPEGMAVITDDLIEDGQQFFVTAGWRFIADPYVCVSCPDPNMFFDTDYSCVCIDGYVLTGETSVSNQSCIKYNPSVSTSYSRVQFRDPFSLESSNEFTLDSLTFSHMYMKAASDCEFYVSSSGTSRRSCQALANLCVLSMYDQDTPACKQLERISQNRVESYHGLAEWKLTLPWLFYRDEPEHIINDRGISMKVSFHPEVDHVSVLRFKVAKYTLNGTFLGIVDVKNHFEFCANGHLGGDDGRSHWSEFGLSYRVEHLCPISSLLGQEMFFYDIYLVDESSDSCRPEWDCLYPIPVLNRNLVKNSRFPNINQRPGDDIDDVYTRRFFLFDNESGRTSSGTAVLRFAKKIVLKIQIQSEKTTRLYPPILTIEYATATKGSWSGEEEVTSVFQVEYSMRTNKFWESIQIMIGFLCAIAIVIFGIRLNNWQSRQRTSDDSGLTGSIFSLSLVLQVFMVASHTFVVLLFSFIFMICTYWFIFFKLQNEVFLLLPPETEFIFFVTSFHTLFWFQTSHVACVIANQCTSDILFVDWESRREAKSRDGVSMWRLATVANHLNKMQSRRRSSIEFSLMFVGFVMIGLHQDQNSLPHPNFHYNYNDNNHNIALGFANTVLFWFAAAAIQWLWRFIVYERFFDEPPSTKFVDLCTMCNISVFMMSENHRGYYLHGKSPYESADCSMEELMKNLNREGKGTTNTRGLVGATGECQIFTFFASPAFRRQISKIYSYARPSHRHFYQLKYDTEKTSLARAETTVFLQSFINRQLGEGLSYVVRESWFAERHLSVTPAEFRTKTEPKCIMYPDDHGFLSLTFLDIGIEVNLVIHDILTYNAASMAFNNVGISIFLTYIMHLLRTALRSWLGKQNLSDKSLIDSRFFE